MSNRKTPDEEAQAAYDFWQRVAIADRVDRGHPLGPDLRAEAEKLFGPLSDAEVRRIRTVMFNGRRYLSITRAGKTRAILVN
ncbi:MAG: hypothetical protein WBX49_00410 [Candidatus Deferrimicrobiaceae bacterium]